MNHVTVHAVESRNLLAGVLVPQAELVARAFRDEPAAIKRENQRIEAAQVVDLTYLFPGRRLPKGYVATQQRRRSQQFAVWRKRQRVRVILLPLEALQDLSGSDTAKLHFVCLIAACQLAAVGRKRQASSGGVLPFPNGFIGIRRENVDSLI